MTAPRFFSLILRHTQRHCHCHCAVLRGGVRTAHSLLQTDAKLLSGQGRARGRSLHRGRSSAFLNGSQLFVMPVGEQIGASAVLGGRDFLRLS